MEKDELATILAIRGGDLVGVCRPCYGPEWHRLLYGGEDDDGYVDELVDEALKRRGIRGNSWGSPEETEETNEGGEL